MFRDEDAPPFSQEDHRDVPLNGFITVRCEINISRFILNQPVNCCICSLNAMPLREEGVQT